MLKFFKLSAGKDFAGKQEFTGNAKSFCQRIIVLPDVAVAIKEQYKVSLGMF